MRRRRAFLALLTLLTSLTLPVAEAAFPADVVRLLDTSIDPCEDFYQYACGGWLANATLPHDRQSYSYSFNAVSDRNDRVIKAIATQNRPLVGPFWQSCMALDALTARGNAPLQSTLVKIAATTTKSELLRVAAEISSVGPSVFVAIAIGADVRNASVNVLYGSNGDLTLPTASYYLKNQTFQSVERAYRAYVSTLLQLAGVVETASDATNAVNIVVAMEKNIAAITPTPEDARDAVKSYYPLSYNEATVRYPLAFGAFGDGLRLLERSALTTSTKMVLRSLAYFDAVETLLATAELSALRLYVAFRYSHYVASYLGEPFLAARFELFGKTLNGLTARAPRLRVCVRAVMTFLPDEIGKYYAQEMLDAKRLASATAMVAAIERAMADRIASVGWLDDATRAEAQGKLLRVTNLIGRSATAKPDPVALQQDDYVGNVVVLNAIAFNRALDKIAQPVDRTEWSVSPAEVNAYYSAPHNKMVFPAAILQPPFFSGGAVDPAQNFGAIGAVIGHELTHGFDHNGRKYDGTGTQRDWWTRATAARFEARAQCLKTQYSTFVVVDSSGITVGNVDGNATVGENIADNGGVRLALDAYRRFVNSSGVRDGTETEIEREGEQLFFVAFGQMWCSAARDAFVRQQLLTREPHAPNKWRVNGVAMNSAAFARAFQCARGRPMNPAPSSKCELW